MSLTMQKYKIVIPISIIIDIIIITIYKSKSFYHDFKRVSLPCLLWFSFLSIHFDVAKITNLRKMDLK